VETEKGGNVPKLLCACDGTRTLATHNSFPRGEAYLFKDSIPQSMKLQIRNEIINGHTVSWIVFDDSNDNVCMDIEKSGEIPNVCRICNFPDFAKEWNIPVNGCKVRYEGITYDACVPIYGTANFVGFDYVLTSLTLK
jgi:hypothetical protein